MMCSKDDSKVSHSVLVCSSHIVIHQIRGWGQKRGDCLLTWSR